MFDKIDEIAIEELSHDNVSLLHEGVFISVIHADKIPPHIGLIVEGRFYSLKTNGKDDGIELTSLLKILDSKNIATLFYTITPVNTDFKAKVESVFNEFDQIPADGTCLRPINQLLSPDEDFNTIRPLLIKLANENKSDSYRIGKCYGLNLPHGFEGIKSYTLDDIKKRINQLRNVE